MSDARSIGLDDLSLDNLSEIADHLLPSDFKSWMSTSASLYKRLKPRQLEHYLKKFAIQSIHPARSFILLRTEEGDVYISDKASNPSFVPTLLIKITEEYERKMHIVISKTETESRSSALFLLEKKIAGKKIETSQEIKVYGNNSFGQLGVGHQKECDTLTLVRKFSDEKIKEIISNNECTFYLMENGDVYACGNNNYGQLGFFPKESVVLSPRKIPDLSNVKQIKSHVSNAFFRLENGEIMACGNNGFGQRTGYPEKREEKSDPTLIPNLCNVIDFETDGRSVFYLFDNSNVIKVCGLNTSGQLGVGDMNNRYELTEVSFVAPVKKIVIQQYSVFAVLRDGSAWSWGKNDEGLLGQGDILDRNVPTLIPDLIDVDDIVTDGFSVFFRLNDGTTKVCGRNNLWQLGLPLELATSRVLSPLPLVLQGIKDIKLHSNSTFITTDKGELLVWGSNSGHYLDQHRGAAQLLPKHYSGLATIMPKAAPLHAKSEILNNLMLFAKPQQKYRNEFYHAMLIDYLELSKRLIFVNGQNTLHSLFGQTVKGYDGKHKEATTLPGYESLKAFLNTGHADQEEILSAYTIFLSMHEMLLLWREKYRAPNQRLLDDFTRLLTALPNFSSVNDLADFFAKTTIYAEGKGKKYFDAWPQDELFTQKMKYFNFLWENILVIPVVFLKKATAIFLAMTRETVLESQVERYLEKYHYRQQQAITRSLGK